MSLTGLNKLLVDLKVIGRIEENGRVSTTGRHSITLESDSALQALWRMLYGDSRERAVETITQVVSGVIDISASLLESPHLLDSDEERSDYAAQTREKLVLALHNTSKDMHAAMRGISNLSRTYQADPVMTAKLEQLIGDIEHHVQKIDQRLAHLREIQAR